MKDNKDPYLGRRLLGQVLVESGQRRQDKEAVEAGARLLQSAEKAKAKAKATKTP